MQELNKSIQNKKEQEIESLCKMVNVPYPIPEEYLIKNSK